MTGLLLDIKNNKTQVVEAEGLEQYYELLDCSLIDIVQRRIGRKRFEIICDDEGTFKEDYKISAINNLGQPMLVGSLLICGRADMEGELTSLTDDEITYIKERIQKMCTKTHPEGYLMLTQCEY